MKILRCHIENFGKLANFDYEFNNGINTIKEENGFGKTTFANFIKAMFYGLESKRSTKVLIDRKKYMPWQGGTFGGNLEFEINEKKYKIERTFGKKENEDTFKLYDLSTNLECDDFSTNIGEEIFKLNKEAYERSTFISGQNMQTSMNDSINAKLGNILENENDINTSEKALKVIDEAIKTYKKTGGRGELNEKIAQKTKLEKKLEQSKIDEMNLQERKTQNEELKKQIKEKEEEQEKYKKMLKLKSEEETKNVKIQNYNMLKSNLEESKELLAKYETFFKAGIPSDEEIETLIDKCLSVEKYKVEVKNYEISPKDVNEIEKLKIIFQNKQITEEDINTKITQCNNVNDIKNKLELNAEKISNLNIEKEKMKKQAKNNKIVTIILFVSSIILIIAGLYFISKTNRIIYCSILGIGLILLVFNIIRAIFQTKKANELIKKQKQIIEYQNVQRQLQEEERKIQTGIEEFINKYSDDEIKVDNIIQLTEIKTNFIKYSNLKNTIDTLFAKQNEVRSKLYDLEDSIKKYLLKYFDSVTNSYTNYAQEIKINKNEFIKQKQDYGAKLKVFKSYEKENNILEVLNKTNNEQNELEQINKNDIEDNLNKISSEINKMNDQKNYNKNQIEILECNLDSVFDTENELEEVNQYIDQIKSTCDILEKTKKYLEKAKNQFSSHYLSGMQESFIRNLKTICEKELTINLDVNLAVQVNEQGAGREIRYFSTGYTDLIYICMRLSLIDALFKDEKPFIILDDPFVNLDEEKIDNALKLLDNIASKYQVIYFVCHESRKNKQ